MSYRRGNRQLSIRGVRIDDYGGSSNLGNNKFRKKKVINYIIYFMLFVSLLFYIFTEEVDGKFALFTKAYFPFLYFIIGIWLLLTVFGIIKKLIFGNVGIKKLSEIVFVLFLIVIAVFPLFHVGKYIVTISRDIIDGPNTTSLMISDRSKVVKKKIGYGQKAYITGTTESGSEITLEVDPLTYAQIITIQHAKNIDIKYWKHSKILRNWKIE